MPLLPLRIVSLFVMLALAVPVYSRPEQVQRSPLVFRHQGCDHAQLKLLKKQYDYDQVLTPVKDEYQKMVMLKHWVYKKLTYSFHSDYPSLRNARTILRLNRKGVPFLCTSYAAVYMQAALSMGWTARYFFLRSQKGLMHAGVEVWSNQFNKWIYMDPTWGIHVEKKGFPLSLGEIRNLWLMKNDPRKLKFVFGAGTETQQYTVEEFPVKRRDSLVWIKMPLDTFWLDYTYQLVLVSRNDFFSFGDGSGRNVWNSAYVHLDKLNYRDRKKFFPGRKRVSLKQIYHPLSQVHYRLKHTGSTVEVRFSHRSTSSFTPDFDYFQVRYRGRWEKTGRLLRLPVQAVKKNIQARIINRCGAPGPVKTIVIPAKGRVRE